MNTKDVKQVPMDDLKDFFNQVHEKFVVPPTRSVYLMFAYGYLEPSSLCAGVAGLIGNLY